MADLVEETVLAIRARMSELAPVVAEYERLQAAYAALEGPGAESADRLSARAGARGGRDTSARSRARAFGVAAVASARAPGSEQGGGVRRDRGAAGCDRDRDRAGDGDRQAVDLQHDAGGVERGELDRVALPGGQQGFRVRDEASAPVT